MWINPFLLSKFNKSCFISFLFLLIYLASLNFFVLGLFLLHKILSGIFYWNLFILRKFLLNNILNLLSLWLDRFIYFNLVFDLNLIFLNLFKIYLYDFFLECLLYLLMFNVILDFVNNFLRYLWLNWIFNLLFNHFKIIHINIIKFICLLSDFFLKLFANLKI